MPSPSGPLLNTSAAKIGMSALKHGMRRSGGTRPSTTITRATGSVTSRQAVARASMMKASASALRDLLDRLPDTKLPLENIPWPQLDHEPIEERYGVLKPIKPYRWREKED